MKQGLAYAGIGARATPPEVRRLMTRIAERLGQLGYTLRTGGADGADQAFLEGALKADTPVELYLPARRHKGHTQERYGNKVRVSSSIPDAAFELARAQHPAWDRLSDFVRRLHARNAQILMGKNLDDPVRFVIAWTKDGKVVGGTGMSIRIARAQGIPVVNLFDDGALEEIARLLR